MLLNILKSFLLSGGTQMGGALWFICILLKIQFLYIVIDYLIKKIFKETIITQSVISLCLLIIGFLMHLNDITVLSLDKVFSYYCLFFIGYVLKRFKISEFDRHTFFRLIVCLFCFLILIICLHLGNIELADTSYTNPLFLIITSLVGWQLLYELSYFISKIKILSNILIFIGMNTLSVVILHFLSFKIVSYIGIRITNSPDFLLACFPIYIVMPNRNLD